MTMQIRDSISYLGKDYFFSDVENEDQMPQITDYGIIPEKFSSACWRGYFLKYEISAHIAVSDIMLKSKDNNYPVINNVSAVPYNKHPYEGFIYTYQNVNLTFHYTGKMLICRNDREEVCITRIVDRLFEETENQIKDFSLFFRRNRNVNIQFYSEVLELEFFEGKLINVRDMSEQSELLRQLILKNPITGSLKPSQKERLSDDILLTVFGDYEWWMHREITADMKQAESDLRRIVK
ncbi:MAG: hypothetical protein J5999_11135 [Oscillospiraceae bacterium]|nr:hypothetical protein [Oscillospiraceae bacterium]